MPEDQLPDRFLHEWMTFRDHFDDATIPTLFIAYQVMKLREGLEAIARIDEEETE